MLVVAASALAFRQEEGQAPDYEIYATDPTVPTLARATGWGEGDRELWQDGDQVLLLDVQNRPVDVVVYGDAAYPGVMAHPGVALYTHSLERHLPGSDSDDCSRDFRDWPFPNPGRLPRIQVQPEEVRPTRNPIFFAVSLLSVVISEGLPRLLETMDGHADP